MESSQGELGDVVNEGCFQLTCVRKGRKLKWVKNPEGGRCCSYEGDMFPVGQKVAQLWTTDNCTQVTATTITTMTSVTIVHPSGEPLLRHRALHPGGREGSL